MAPALNETAFSDQTIQAALSPFGVGLTPSQSDRVRRYLRLLLLWNQKINLTSVSDPAEILERHFGESMFGISMLPMRPRRLADVGSGAGFPGLPLKILRPDLHVLLIEANIKKMAFLREVVRELGLSAVDVIRERYEDVSVRTGFADVITARAVGDIRRLLRWSACSLSLGGKVLLWLGSEDAKRIRRFGAWRWEDPVPIPGSKRRVIVSGTLPPLG